MPEFKGTVNPIPFVRIGLSPLQSGGQFVNGRGLIDTGAAKTSIDLATAKEWGFKEVDKTKIDSATHKGELMPVYEVLLELRGGGGHLPVWINAVGFKGDGAPVSESDRDKVIALIGRDILARGSLRYNGRRNRFTLRLT